MHGLYKLIYQQNRKYKLHHTANNSSKQRVKVGAAGYKENQLITNTKQVRREEREKLINQTEVTCVTDRKQSRETRIKL